ncbi:MAG TPA: response regulator [Rhizomicrobium sp.]|jgi:two-component system phosphate regulon response regulator PhoB
MLKPTVLLAEDEGALITLLRYNLEREGYRVLEAHNGEEALLVVQEHQPDLILLDWMLPQLSGLEVCRRRPTRPQCPDRHADCARRGDGPHPRSRYGGG